MTDQIEIQMNAARVCDAIARIGYRSESAIMDIVDNSITAGASRIRIEIERVEGTTYAQKSNFHTVRILDNGKGMSNADIVNALKLGSNADYPNGSLSKYGMGLKSAGFSLGLSINVFSIQNMENSSLNYVDRDVVAAQEKYIICREEAPRNMISRLVNFLNGDPNGTLIEIQKCDRRSHQSSKRTIDNLRDQLGVTYYSFFKREFNPLSIIISSGMEEIEVKPLDILFLDKATEFDRDSYTGKYPCIVFDEEFMLSDTHERPIGLTVTLFPKDEMKKSIHLTKEEREQINEYQISSKNNGFFIYRNGRLIRWGDSLGLIGRDMRGFRAKLELTTEHDDYLNVDVSKQRLDMPEEVIDKLSQLIRIPKRQHQEVFAACDDIDSKDEGFAFDQRNQYQAEEDLVSESEVDSKEKTTRRKKLVDQTLITIEEVSAEKEGIESKKSEEPDPSSDSYVFRKVRYSDKVRSPHLWDAGYDTNEGTFVRINRNHSYYYTVMTTLDESDKYRQAFEAILWCSAVAETLTIQNLTNIDAETIGIVINKFKQVFSVNLDNWSLGNQDIF